MTDFLKGIFDKYWSKPSSLVILYPLCILGTCGLISNDLTDLQLKDFIIIITVAILCVIYTVFVYLVNRLPRAKQMNRAALFVITAESDVLYEDIKKKLISEFCAYINSGSAIVFDAQYINASRINKEKLNLDIKENVIRLLQKTNCAFLVRIRYVVDSVTNTENYAINIDCGIVHPELNDQAQRLLQYDLNDLAKPIRKRKFKKNQIIDEMEFTAHQLSRTCIYIIGLVELFSGNYQDAYALFKKLYMAYVVDFSDRKERFNGIVKYWFYVSCVQNSRSFIDSFKTEKNLAKLENANLYLEEANTLYPGTYEYYLDKAYYLIATQRDVIKATKCIEECKRLNRQPSWRYSDAFLAAFNGRAASTIIDKYSKAFRFDEDLLAIVDYIEYIIDKDQNRIGLHLAAALVYRQISDTALQEEHIQYYYHHEPKLKNIETARRHFSKLSHKTGSH